MIIMTIHRLQKIGTTWKTASNKSMVSYAELNKEKIKNIYDAHRVIENENGFIAYTKYMGESYKLVIELRKASYEDDNSALKDSYVNDINVNGYDVDLTNCSVIKAVNGVQYVSYACNLFKLYQVNDAITMSNAQVDSNYTVNAP